MTTARHRPSFELFLALWNAAQGQDTPRLHRRMAAWLTRAARSRTRRALLMAFRGSGKSTITGLFCAWLLLLDPELRILVVAADEALAANMVRHVRRVLEAHPLTRHLLPPRREQWAADRLIVARTNASRDPSLRAAGLFSNVTGARADIVICDDVEVPKTCDSAWKREQLRTKLTELDFIRTPGAMTLYIGTPHAEDSLYKPDGFLHAYQRLEIPLDANAWPERFDETAIAALKSAVAPSVFASQMELQPAAIGAIRLDPALLCFYDGAPHAVTARRCHWDPAFAGAAGDASVVALVLFDAQDVAYVHDIAYLRSHCDNAAASQCSQIVAFLQRHDLKQITVEGNGLGQFLPGLLRAALREAGHACAVTVLHNTRPKAQRIAQAFEARLAGRALHLHTSVRDTPFIAEMQDWHPARKHGRDDGLDAVACALLAGPVARSRPLGRQFQAVTDFAADAP